jgi:hypothetical protein
VDSEEHLPHPARACNHSRRSRAGRPNPPFRW